MSRAPSTVTAPPVSVPASSSVAAVMVVRDEPLSRLRRAIGSLADQRGVAGIDLVVAAPLVEHRRLGALHPHGAVASVRLVANPGGERSAGLNRALAECAAEFVVRLDARAVLPTGYVANCVNRLEREPGVGVVGGVQWPVPVRDDPRAQGIARALRNRWMLGNPSYRRPDNDGAVDTVYLGVFRRRQLLQLGGYDRRLAANEDFELCARIRDEGMQIWLEPEATIAYEPRDHLLSLWHQYRSFGASKVRLWRLTGRRPNARQVVALAAGGCALMTTAASLRKPGRTFALLALAGGGALIVDHVADPGESDLRVRAYACVSYAAIVTGWLAGIVSEASAPRASGGSGDVEHALQRDPRPLGGVRVDGDLVHDLAPHE